jgi:hypothetical protein
MYAQPDVIDRHLEAHNGWVVSETTTFGEIDVFERLMTNRWTE